MAGLRSVSELTILGLPPGGITPAFERWLSAHPVAGFLLFRRDYETPDDLPELARRVRALNGDRRTFVALDEEGGCGRRGAEDGESVRRDVPLGAVRTGPGQAEHVGAERGVTSATGQRDDLVVGEDSAVEAHPFAVTVAHRRPYQDGPVGGVGVACAAHCCAGGACGGGAWGSRSTVQVLAGRCPPLLGSS